ncbi:MAG: acyl-CoA dehydrogenase family protein [Vicinamibacterales bacterium]
MDFDLTPVQQSWQQKGRALGRELEQDASAADVVTGAAQAGLLDVGEDILSVVVALEALASESASAAAALAIHTAAMLAVAGDRHFHELPRGEAVGALTLSTESVPALDERTLSGCVSWVAPLTAHGVAVVAGRQGEERVACAVRLDTAGVSIEDVRTAALRGFVCGHLTLDRAPCVLIGPTRPVMSLARIFIAAAGIGMGRRAVRESLGSVRGTSRGAGGEQTVQGLVADAATELDAAMLLTWKAATTPLSLAAASMAKLAATGAAQRALERTTQIVGADTFRHGHVIEQLAQDVRALELFAGRTEALREAVACEDLPQPQS